VLVDKAKFEWAEHLREQGNTIAEIVKKTGIPRCHADRAPRWCGSEDPRPAIPSRP
jgi:hypothetical protein